MLLFISFLFVLLICFLLFYVRLRCLEKRVSEDSYAFFHPYCNAGGGGERVLWQCVLALCDSQPDCSVTVYTGDTTATPDQIVADAEKCFGLSLPKDRITFVYLRWRVLVEAKCYPVLTLLGQSLGSVFLGLEALLKHPTGYWIDTMGYAFTYPLAYICGCDIVSYVHYPTISTDMLGLVKDRTSAYNNSSAVARNHMLSSLKLIYYKMFAWLYSKVGSLSQVVFVNSSWTEGHIEQLWGGAERTYKLYPPCNTTEYLNIKAGGRERKIISLAQFRPEKNHKLQVEAFAKFMESYSGNRDVKMVVIGGVRNNADRQRVEELRTLVDSLGLSDIVTIKTSIPYSELYQEISTSLMGLHTMWNEHFGIGIVEFMASGIVPIAHNSGGPKLDIVIPGTGFLAQTPEEYSSHIHRVLCMSSEELLALTTRARTHVKQTFSDENFRSTFVKMLSKHLELDI